MSESDKEKEVWNLFKPTFPDPEGKEFLSFHDSEWSTAYKALRSHFEREIKREVLEGLLELVKKCWGKQLHVVENEITRQLSELPTKGEGDKKK